MEGTGQIYSLIPKIMGEVGAIAKNKRNQAQGYQFRGIDDVYLAFQGPLAKYGVFYVPQVLERTVCERETKNGSTLFYTILKMAFTFFAADGSSFQAVTVGEAMDSGDKSTNKAMSAALKYALLQTFCIPTEEPKDSENDTHSDIKPGAKQVAKLEANGNIVAATDPTPDAKEAAMIALDEACAAKGWVDAEKHSMLVKAAKQKNLKSAVELTADQFRALAAGVASGSIKKPSLQGKAA